MPRPFLILLLLCSALLATAAEAATATAAFSARTAEVGEALRFQIEVQGSATQIPAPTVNVDGLQFRFQGPHREESISFNNGFTQRKSSITYVYEVVAERPGTFTVPALSLEIDGEQVETAPVSLKVQPGGTAATSQGLPYRAEIVPAKTSAYIGEQVPVEIRIMFAEEIRGGPRELPVLQGDAFTKLKVQQAGRREIEKGDRTWAADIFETVVTPIRAGKLSLGPVETNVQVIMPRNFRGNRRGQMLLDEWFGRDLQLGMGGVAEPRRATAPAVEMTIKQLPAAGRPKNFSGAVGQFALALDRTPSRVKINDPITLRFVVTGKGNFERLTAPAPVSDKGWRVYPPSENFIADNDRIGGTKIFEIAIIPEAKQTQLPEFELNYFDPNAEKYVSLKSVPSPLIVEGEPAPAPAPIPAPATAAAPAVGNAPAATPAPAPAATSIMGIRYDAGEAASLRPLHRQPGFWAAQAVPALVLLALLARRFRKSDTTRRDLAALRRERSRLLTKLRGEQDRHTFYDTAARLLQVEAALRTGRAPETVDAALVRRVAPDNHEVSAVLTEIFDTRAEAVYAGAQSSGGPISAPERERILGAVATMERALA